MNSDAPADLAELPDMSNERVKRLYFYTCRCKITQLPSFPHEVVPNACPERTFVYWAASP